MNKNIKMFANHLIQIRKNKQISTLLNGFPFNSTSLILYIPCIVWNVLAKYNLNAFTQHPKHKHTPYTYT